MLQLLDFSVASCKLYDDKAATVSNGLQV